MHHQLFIDDHFADDTVNCGNLQLKHLWEGLHTENKHCVNLGKGRSTEDKNVHKPEVSVLTWWSRTHCCMWTDKS